MKISIQGVHEAGDLAVRGVGSGARVDGWLGRGAVMSGVINGCGVTTRSLARIVRYVRSRASAGTPCWILDGEQTQVLLGERP